MLGVRSVRGWSRVRSNATCSCHMLLSPPCTNSCRVLALPGDAEPCILTSFRPCAVCVKRFLHRDGISRLTSTARNRTEADLGLAAISCSSALMAPRVRSVKNGWASGGMTGRPAGTSTRSPCAMNDLTVLSSSE